ncbi:PadR family transcriptional regulator [Pararoseomonas indoligenes]|uniref:PadR family transcriptional regulator n=1 Tax=Roseomonas indoligenes TaxID=2820811 RepID=UPI001FD7DD36|nr:PadR family transcriptional regulator [Pararoseomonas indoligenes]
MNPFRHHCGRHERRRFHRDPSSSADHRRHGRGGRGGRFFEAGDLRLVILRLIAERPRHGYEIIKDIEERLAGAYSPSPGVIYPTLTLLEELGQIAVQSTEGGRKLYAVTPEGEAALAASREEADTLFARMDALSGEGPDGSVLQLKRAVHNLRNALRMRLSRGPLTEEQLHGIVAMIDEMALKVERT